MNVEWIKKMMLKWGEASYGRAQCTSGSGSSYPAYQLVHIRSSAVRDVPVDSDVLRIDEAMAHVKAFYPKLYSVACDIYVQGFSAATCSGRQRCHLDTVYARLEKLHEIVLERLRARCSRIATVNA